VGEVCDPGQRRGPSGVDPVQQVSAGALSEHLGEVAYEFMGLLQLRAGGEHCLELPILVLGEGVGMAGDPADDGADRRRRGGRGGRI